MAVCMCVGIDMPMNVFVGMAVNATATAFVQVVSTAFILTMRRISHAMSVDVLMTPAFVLRRVVHGRGVMIAPEAGLEGRGVTHA